MDTWNAIGLLVLGWLFGLLSPVITRKIEQERNAAIIQKGIAAELKELSSRLAMASSLITVRFGDYTKDHVRWVITVLSQGGKSTNDMALIDIFKRQLELGDADFNVVVAHQKAEENAGLGLKKYQAPYLTSKLGELSLFSEDLQRTVLEIIANLQMFNEEVDNARYYFNLTYDESLSPENHAQVKASIAQSYLNVSNRARIVADAAVEYIVKHASNQPADAVEAA